MIRYYWISFSSRSGRGALKHEERVAEAHPFVAIREMKLKRKNNNIALLNYKPINKKEYDLFIKLNTTEV